MKTVTKFLAGLVGTAALALASANANAGSISIPIVSNDTPVGNITSTFDGTSLTLTGVTAGGPFSLTATNLVGGEFLDGTLSVTNVPLFYSSNDLAGFDTFSPGDDGILKFRFISGGGSFPPGTPLGVTVTLLDTVSFDGPWSQTAGIADVYVTTAAVPTPTAFAGAGIIALGLGANYARRRFAKA